jgi:hypothetical protein
MSNKVKRVFSKEKFFAHLRSTGDDCARYFNGSLKWPHVCDMREVVDGCVVGTPYNDASNYGADFTIEVPADEAHS